MNHREQIIDAVCQAVPAIDHSAAELATAVVLSFPLDVIHYAKDDKPQPRIREGKVVGLAERTDGWRAR